MSYRKEKQKSLLGLDVNQLEKNELQNLSQSVLNAGMHGLCLVPMKKVKNLEI